MSIMELRDLTYALNNWSEENAETLGFYQEWKVTAEVVAGSRFLVTVAEDDDGHILVEGIGDTLDEAVLLAYNDLPDAMNRWSWPEFRLETPK